MVLVCTISYCASSLPAPTISHSARVETMPGTETGGVCMCIWCSEQLLGVRWRSMTLKLMNSILGHRTHARDQRFHYVNSTWFWMKGFCPQYIYSLLRAGLSPIKERRIDRIGGWTGSKMKCRFLVTYYINLIVHFRYIIFIYTHC